MSGETGVAVEERISKPRGRRRVVWLVAGCIVILALVTSGAVVWYKVYGGPIPSKYRSGLNYTLYYPRNLPNGYTVDRKSYQRKGKVLIFNLVAPHARNVAVSEETLPAGLDLTNNGTSPSGITLPDRRNFTTPAGQATLSLWGDKTVVSIVAQNTWIILNVTGLNTQTSTTIANSFTKL